MWGSFDVAIDSIQPVIFLALSALHELSVHNVLVAPFRECFLFF